MAAYRGGKNMGGWIPIYFGGTDEDANAIVDAFNRKPNESIAALKKLTVEERIQESLDACKKILKNW